MCLALFVLFILGDIGRMEWLSLTKSTLQPSNPKPAR